MRRLWNKALDLYYLIRAARYQGRVERERARKKSVQSARTGH